MINPKTAPVLVFAVGNASRGDDAMGPLMLRQLDAWLIDGKLAGEFELLEDFQLQIEHTLDMQARLRVLIIDAGMDTPSPFAFYRVKAGNEPVLYTHALSPEALLAVYTQCYQEAPPDMYVLCIRGESFELGEPLSPAARINLDGAFVFAQHLLLKPDATSWNKLCTT